MEQRGDQIVCISHQKDRASTGPETPFGLQPADVESESIVLGKRPARARKHLVSKVQGGLFTTGLGYAHGLGDQLVHGLGDGVNTDTIRAPDPPERLAQASHQDVGAVVVFVRDGGYRVQVLAVEEIVEVGRGRESSAQQRRLEIRDCGAREGGRIVDHDRGQAEPELEVVDLKFQELDLLRQGAVGNTGVDVLCQCAVLRPGEQTLGEDGIIGGAFELSMPVRSIQLVAPDLMVSYLTGLVIAKQKDEDIMGAG